MSKNLTLEQLAVDHPYYCSHHNYFSNDWSTDFNSWHEFIEDGPDDLDLNLIFRFDLHRCENSEVYELHLYYILQRKGIFMSQHIKNITKHQEKEIVDFLMKRYAHIRQLWQPFSDLENMK